jgi:DNA-binding transcriptional LysR family regulator
MKITDLQLRQFLAIASAGSVSKAADALGLTQSGLSKQLSLLEAALGQTLFERHGRGVVLSSAGKTLHDAIRPSYDLIDATVTRLREEQGITEGRLRIATIHPLSTYFVTGVIAKFMGATAERECLDDGAKFPGRRDFGRIRQGRYRLRLQ